MTDKKNTLASLFLCTTMALLTSPAFAHDGPHQMTYLQAMLHELAYTDHLPAALAIAAAGVIATAGMRLRRRKAARR
ncbi:MAG: hypothetical protein JWM30_3559 [Burkholderia sp.]|jgi:hydrogenase/urease accessory protein HupE|nr:hypothetical protein [Burkholderia sp.]